MKEIVVISGKGGTGKTSITAAFTALLADKAIVADCDVDAADMHLLLEPDFGHSEDFQSGQLAVINQELCSSCGLCESKCRFDAITEKEGVFSVNLIDCEGCGYCSLICPQEAIDMVDQIVGKFYISNTRFGSTLVHARLGIGAENSGKLVAKVKNEAKQLAEKQKLEYVIVDGSPGIGCPVVSSLSGADFVVLVTEPTTSGLHDLRRVYKLVDNFGIKAGCIINKADLNNSVADEIKSFLKEEGIDLISMLPYSKIFTESIIAGRTLMEVEDKSIANLIEKSWSKIIELTN